MAPGRGLSVSPPCDDARMEQGRDPEAMFAEIDQFTRALEAWMATGDHEAVGPDEARVWLDALANIDRSLLQLTSLATARLEQLGEIECNTSVQGSS